MPRSRTPSTPRIPSSLVRCLSQHNAKMEKRNKSSLSSSVLLFSLPLLFFAATILTWDHQCEEGPVVVSPSPSHPTTKGRPHEDSLDFSHLSLCELQTDSATNEQLNKEKEKCSQVWIIFIFIDLGKKSVFSDHL